MGFALMILVASLDYWTGQEIAWALFYLIPVSLVSWFTDKRLGIIVSIGSAAVWLIVDIASSRTYSHPLIEFWNAFSRLGFFLVVTWLLSSLKMAMSRERELSHIDYMTGAVNSRFFISLVQKEIDRCNRYKHPFTIAYVDLDNFKTVNDRFGHHTGDGVLRTVTDCIREHLRKTDIVARMGGDEFAILLLETGEEGAKVVVSKIQLGLLEEMGRNSWPVTFSIGVLTCVTAPRAVDEMIMMADNLMYSVKHGSKNGVVYSTLAV